MTAYNKDCAECQEIIHDTIASYGEDELDEDVEPEFILIDDDSFNYGC